MHMLIVVLSLRPCEDAGKAKWQQMTARKRN
jgi:hypothetical protein